MIELADLSTFEGGIGIAEILFLMHLHVNQTAAMIKLADFMNKNPLCWNQNNFIIQ